MIYNDTAINTLKQSVATKSQHLGSDLVEIALNAGRVRYCTGKSIHLSTAIPTAADAHAQSTLHALSCCSVTAAVYGAVAITKQSHSPTCIVVRTGSDAADALPPLVRCRSAAASLSWFVGDRCMHVNRIPLYLCL